uniref:Uncharacterized protein n=1 Tax=Megaselia scalaris TaxID=36166 RepID=T1GQL9_MEGSC
MKVILVLALVYVFGAECQIFSQTPAPSSVFGPVPGGRPTAEEIQRQREEAASKTSTIRTASASISSGPVSSHAAISNSLSTPIVRSSHAAISNTFTAPNIRTAISNSFPAPAPIQVPITKTFSPVPQQSAHTLTNNGYQYKSVRRFRVSRTINKYLRKSCKAICLFLGLGIV